MTLNVRVAGGTDAGNRPPFAGKPKDWQCGCVTSCDSQRVTLFGEPEVRAGVKVNPGYLARCSSCGERRP